MSQPLRLGIAGLGTVGVGLIKIVQNHADLLQARTGKEISITAVSARSRSKDRGVDLDSYGWEDDPVALAKRQDVDLFVELIGGEDGPAKAATEAAIAAGKDVVTANKAMLAIHGQALALAAEKAGVSLRYEAAVAGGIPVVKSLVEGLAGNQINRILGVMNGTCNYILTRMESAGLSYDTVFEEANQLGYLEADPNLDVGGIDAGHKLAILASAGFGTEVNFAGVNLQGIQDITIDDIASSAEIGFRIKLLGLAEMTDGKLVQSMQPCLVSQESPLAQLEGGTNMVILEGDSVGQIVLRGAGAGEGPTASAVMADIADIARGVCLPVFGRAATDLVQAEIAQKTTAAAYYLRLNLIDEPGTLAKVSGALADQNISIDRMRQKSHQDHAAPVIIVTHEVTPDAIQEALARIEAQGICVTKPVALRIETI